MKIAISTNATSLLARATALAKQLELPLVSFDNIPPATEFLLVVTEERLELRVMNSHLKAIFVDFLHGSLAYRHKHGGGTGQLIAKAVGIKKQPQLTVLDATAGLGSDAFVLASLGCEVTMVEKSTLIAALLHDGLERAHDFLESNNIQMKLTVADSISYMQTLTSKPDVVYLDPMYPSTGNTALAKKEMHILRRVVDSDQKPAELLAAALQTAKKRVVVKRPRLAKSLTDAKPDLVYCGKSSRFDVYFT